MENFESNESSIEMIRERLYPTSVSIIAGTCAIILSAIGILGNLVTVVALLRYMKLERHTTTVFIINLSISDLMFSAVSLPLTASEYLNEGWMLGETLCQIFPFLFYGNVIVSLLSMVAISINRYVLIVKFDVYARLYTSQGITLMLIAIWVLGFSLLIPSLLGIWGTLGRNPVTSYCTILKKNGQSPKKLLNILSFVIPCVVIIVSYFCIYWKLRNSRKTLEAYSGGRKEGGVQKREEFKATKLMITLFICFLLCFMPSMLVNVIDEEVRIPILHVITSLLACACSVINPFIYAGTNNLYREAYKQVLCSGSNKTLIPGVKCTATELSKAFSLQATSLVITHYH